MDSLNSKPNEKWVEDRLASLTPPAGWRPDVDRALESLLQKRSSSTSPAVRFSMAGATLIVIGAVLMLLPWHVLWTPMADDPILHRPQPGVEHVNSSLIHTGPAPAQESAVIGQAVTGQKDPIIEDQRKTEPPPKTEPIKAELPLSQSPANPEPPPQRKKKEPPIFAANPVLPLGERTPLVAAASAQTQGQQSSPPSDVSAPVVIRKVNPAYTDEARQAKVTGTVELLCLIAVDGTVKVDSVRKSLGYGLDESATAAVEQWEFVPGKKDGKPVATQTTIVINFGLK